MAKAADIRAKTADELNAMLLDLHKEQFNLRFQRATGQSQGIARVRQVRRDIARIKTILHERSRQEAPSAGRASATLPASERGAA